MINDPGGALYTRWTTTDHFLAFISEQLDQLSYLTLLVNSDGKRKPRWKHVQHTRPQLPYDFPRPQKKKRSANTREIRAILRGEL